MLQLLDLLLVTAALLSPSIAEVFRVTPVLPATESCPPPCHTLHQYVQNVSLLTGHTNITLVFLAGAHNLSYSWSFSGNGQDVIMRGQNPRTSPTVTMLTVSALTVTDLASFQMYDINLIGGIDTGGNNNLSLKNISDVGFSAVHFSRISALMENINQIIIKECNLKSSTSGIQASANIVITNTNFNGGNVGLYLDNIRRAKIQNSSISNYRVFGMIIISAEEVVISDGSCISHDKFGIVSVNSGLTVNDTVLTGNDFKIVALVLKSRHQIPEQYQIINVTNSLFSKNNNGALLLLNLQQYNVTIENCTFTSNTGTPISAYQSTFELRGETVFRDNTAARGGGLALYNSTVVFGSNSYTMFINNTATEFGGAIYIGRMIGFVPEYLIAADRINEFGESVPLIQSLGQVVVADNLLEQSCFYQSLESHRIIFNNNTALLGGFDIFGLASRNCSVTRFEYNASDLSFQIASNPTRVCFCTDNVPQCRNKSQLVREETRYPGESFTVSVALAGYNFSRVAGSVYTNVLGRDYSHVIGESRHVQTATLTKCSDVEYTISSNSSAILVLTARDRQTEQGNENEIDMNKRNLQLSSCDNVNNPCTAYLTTPIYIKVTLEDCPLGFMLNDANVCDCDDIINSINNISISSITCEIRNHTGYINREGTVWVGVDTRP